jgi:uncharacterized protein (TIGR04255 family)
MPRQKVKSDRNEVPVKASVSTGRDQALPDFSNPPVDETVLSIQFAPIPGFDIRYFGLYWAEVKNEYPGFQIQPPLPSQIEQFGSGKRLESQVAFHLISEPEIRAWYLDKTGNRLFQFQRDRLVHNWRRVVGTDDYPRYPTLRKSLVSEWQRCNDFLTRNKLARPQANQCEVVYVNHIEYGEDWIDSRNLNDVIAAWAEPKVSAFLPRPERVNMEVHYRFPDDSGRLHVSLQPVIRGRDGKEVLQLTLVARGAPKSPSDEDIFHSLDKLREWVVKGFADFTSEKMQEIWGRRQ